MWSGTGGFDVYDKRRLREMHFVLCNRCIWEDADGDKGRG